MSRILKGLTEAKITDLGPGDEATWPAYSGHPNDPRDPPKRRGRAEPDYDSEPYDPWGDHYRKQDAAQKKYKSEVNVQYSDKEGVAPNGKRYNSTFLVKSKTPYQGDNEIYKFNDAHWGAKNIVDTEKKNPEKEGDPYLTMVYYVDNHKHGYWKPWKDEPPISKGVQFEAELMYEGISEQDLADVLFHRLELRYPDIVSRHGHEVVGDAVADVASFHAGAEELGTSDISIMIKQVLQHIERRGLDEAQGDLDPESALQQARKITSQFKYADMHMDIITKIQLLAEKSGVDRTDLEYLIDDVFEKQRALESAIFSLDEPFEETLRKQQWNDEEINEDLRKWFKEKWVRFGPDGKIRGDCARGDDSEGKPKCLPQSKAHSLGKKGRASAAARKRREDPNPERRGPAKNVATKKKSNEGVAEGWKEESQDLEDWSKEVNMRLYRAHETQRPGLARQLSKIEQKNFGSSLNQGSLTEIVKAALMALQKGQMVHYDPQRVGQMPFGNIVGDDAKIIAQYNITRDELAGYRMLHDKGMVDNLEQFLKLRRLVRAKSWPLEYYQELEKLSTEEAWLKMANDLNWSKDSMNEEVQAKTDDKLLAYYAQRKAEKEKQKQQGVAEGLNEFAPSPGFGGDDDDKYTPADFGKPFKANYLGQNKFEVFCRKPKDPSNVIKLNAEVQKYGLEWEDDFGFWFLDSPGAVYLSWKYGEIPLPKAIDQARNPGHIHDLVVDYLTNSPHAAEIQKIATEYFGFTADGEMNEGVAEAELDEACWKGYHKEGNKKMFGKTYPNCVKNTNEEQEQLDEKCWDTHKQVGMKSKGGKMVPNCVPKESVEEDQAPMFTPEQKCPHCGGPMFEAMLMNEKKDACYYKVKSRYKVWPSAYASGALVKCRKKGADSWGTGGKKNEGMVMGASSDASSAGTRVQGEAANPAQQAAIAIAMKKAGQKPKRESAIMKGLVDETLGTPYPGTYEQETSMIKRKGPERITAMTNEEQVDEKWSQKYKRSIDCNNPKGFSQKAHCQGRKK